MLRFLVAKPMAESDCSLKSKLAIDGEAMFLLLHYNHVYDAALKRIQCTLRNTDLSLSFSTSFILP